MKFLRCGAVGLLLGVLALCAMLLPSSAAQAQDVATSTFVVSDPGSPGVDSVTMELNADFSTMGLEAVTALAAYSPALVSAIVVEGTSAAWRHQPGHSAPDAITHDLSTSHHKDLDYGRLDRLLLR